jgi:SAM-dependent methyltransferase/glycosyltransferase involved in cell wall biosynthesis
VILYVDHQIPRPDEDAGSLRALGILRILKELGHAVSVYADEDNPRPHHLQQVTELGITVVPRGELHGHLADAARRPDLVIIARANVAVGMMPIVRAQLAGVPVIFDTVDLHYRRLGREAALRRDPSASLRALAVKVEELEMARASDLVWVVSENERQALLAEDPRLNVEVLSLIYEIPTERIGYEAREGLGFVGGFQHAPNVDAVRFLVDRIMPRIWAARADVVLAVAGADIPPEIHALEGPGVRIVGHQRDLAPLLSGWRVLVAPLRFGAGVSGKITQALSFGLPAVTTWVGAEGTGLRHDEDVLIADTPETFAAGALELYENRARWERLSEAGQARIRTRFSFEAARTRIGEDLAALAVRPAGALASDAAQGGRAMPTLRDLLEQPPPVHSDRPIAWTIRPALAHFLDDAVGPGSVTLETGAGLSTLVILRKQPRQHTAVQPVPDAFAAILAFAERHRMDIHGFRPIVARSQDWLPRVDLPDLDLVLVNGGHAFPVPFLDWYYGAEKLKVGGLMVVDDTHLPTGSRLADFMGADLRWEPVVRDGTSHFAIYRKLVHRVHDDDGSSPSHVHDACPPMEESPVIRAGAAPAGGPAPAGERGRWAGPRLTCVEVRDWGEYQRYRAAMAGEHRRREAVELSMIDGATESFQVYGHCAVCQRAAPFSVDFTYSYQKTADGRPVPNWRERLVCTCGFNNRVRAAIHILQQEIDPHPDARIYLTERVTALYQWLHRRYPNLVGTEYLGNGVPPGAEHEGIRNEDLAALTFADGSFDLILSLDVMEHVPDSDAALRECFRCLRPGGVLLFSAPFRLDCPHNLERARLRPDGTVEHLMPPEYHWQPLTSENGALSFRDFGWHVLEQMREAGFAEPRALLYWSLELGYLGGDQVLLVGSRPGH